MKRVAAICLVLSGVATASAQEPASKSENAPASTFERCMDASGGVTSEMLGCIGAEIAVQDKRLNETWGRLRQELGEPEMAALRSAQRAWIAYRDARCGAELALAGGGTLSSVVYADCVLAMTVERTGDLDRTLQATLAASETGAAAADP